MGIIGQFLCQSHSKGPPRFVTASLASLLLLEAFFFIGVRGEINCIQPLRTIVFHYTYQSQSQVEQNNVVQQEKPLATFLFIF